MVKIFKILLVQNMDFSETNPFHTTPTLGSHHRVPPQGPTVGSHRRVPPRVLPQGATLRSQTRVLGPGSHLGVLDPSFPVYHYIFKSFPWEFATEFCRGNLPWKFATEICRENLPWKFAVAICLGFFVLVCVCELFLLIQKQTFFYMSETFLL